MNRETLIDAMPREWTTYAIRQHLADALLPVIAADLDAAEARGRAEAWDAGYAAAQLDADEEPYSDRPERATWQPRQNPYRADAMEER